MSAAIGCQRDLFDIPPEVVYLNCASRGPHLKGACDAGREGVLRNAHPWDGDARARTAAEVERARALFGSLVGATADDVALVPSTSYGVAVAAANLPLAAGQRVVTVADQFPSNLHAWRSKAMDAGAEAVMVPRPDDWDWTAAVLAAIDSRTGIVAVPPCHWTDGSALDLVAVGARCREVGAAFVVDATQAAGAMPIDVAALQPDFLTCSGYKWLLCPYTLSFLYAHPRHHRGRPIEHYAWSRDDAPPIGLLRGDDMDAPAGARRFDMGERNNPIHPGIAAAALAQVVEWGPERIAASIEPLTERIAAAAAERGWRVPPEERRARHFLGVRRQGGWPDDLQARLAAVGVHVSLRGDSMRVSPYLYNTEEEVERLFEAADSI